jgi:hypothetical protein
LTSAIFSGVFLVTDPDPQNYLWSIKETMARERKINLGSSGNGTGIGRKRNGLRGPIRIRRKLRKPYARRWA